MTTQNQTQRLRQPIVTVVGHVDHGKTSILDCFRGSSLQKEEAGGITQKISFTNYPAVQIKLACALIEKNGIKLDIPGFLFIDTPGHAAFTNLRKRGGALADLAILVVNIKEGIKPQTAEVLQILKANKTPFVVALNKIDSLSGWKHYSSLQESIDKQAVHTKDEFNEALLTFQGSLAEHGFESGLFFEVDDFTKKIALVPCSAKTKEGISELLLVLCGLCQRFLKERLKLNEDAKGVILEIKKDRGMNYAESILYDGSLDEGDELVIANFAEPILSKVRAIEEIMPLSRKYVPVKKVLAATGVRIQLTNSEGVLPGMPFVEVKSKSEMEKAKVQFKKEMSNSLHLDKQGIIIKADSLGSLEALITLLRQENIQILKAGIGPIGKGDISSAKANIEINPLDAIIVGFNTTIEEEELNAGGVKILTNEVIYKLIEDLALWRKNKQAEIEKEKMMSLATVCKLEILHKYVFRNSNPAIFGVKVAAGEARVGLPLIDDKGEEVARVKSLQHEKQSVNTASQGQELALALPGVTFDRQLKETKYLYSNLSEMQVKQFRKHKELLTESELKVIQEIIVMKQKTKEGWGM